MWKPGESGNPNGAPRGNRHKTTLFCEAILKGDAEGIIRKTMEMARAGDVAAQRLCLERILPPMKSRPITFKLPALRTVSDCVSAMTLIVEGVTEGEILIDEAQALSEMVSSFIKTLEVNELETRLIALEKAYSGAEEQAHFDA
jgi:hypothetical protein